MKKNTDGKDTTSGTKSERGALQLEVKRIRGRVRTNVAAGFNLTDLLCGGFSREID